MLSNPDTIQHPPPSLHPAPTPLVLIHDGGGTIFNYHFLGSLGRAVYGIHNPHFYHPEQVWANGIPEMAGHYAQLVKRVAPKGDVILGGWSLGGCVSLEVARILARDAKIRVVGIIMIDSVCPTAPVSGSGETPRVAERVMKWNDSTRQETKEAVMRCFDEAFRMVRAWTLPIWEEQEPTGTETVVSEKASSRKGTNPPPVWLLRAEDTVPVVTEGVARVDLYRKDRHLGWKNYRSDLIVEVVDIPGHHFNIFAFENLDAVTKKLKTVCEEVESRTDRKSTPGSPIQAEPIW